MDLSLIRRFLSETEVLRAPRHALATFGATRIDYHLISPVEDMKDKTRLREGKISSRRPQILTAQSFAQRFEGFGEEGREFAQFLTGAYADLLRALEYNFKNEGLATRVLSESPQTVAERMKAEMDRDDARDQAVIRCPDPAWSLALMKFTLDESARSFPTNVRDLERRGLFNPEGKENDRRRREIEELFAQAKTSPDAAKLLGAKLREYGLFEEYEDRYLGLF
jgi:hypothetical protein